MNELIEKNRRLLRFCCTNLRSIGLLLLFVGLLGSFAFIIVTILVKFGFWRPQEHYGVIISLIPLNVFYFIFYGLGILGLVQFISYLVEENYKPGWILLHGEKLFYLYALFIILSTVWAYITIANIDSSSSNRLVFSIVVSGLSIVVKVLIMISLGQIVRRILPVIEESKTLV